MKQRNAPRERNNDFQVQNRPPMIDAGSRNHLRVKKAVTGHIGPLDEREKTFHIIEVVFGSFILLMLSEVDAVDDDGCQIKIAASKRCNKILDMWAQAEVTKCSKIVFGSVESAPPPTSDDQETAYKVTNVDVLDLNLRSIQEELEKSATGDTRQTQKAQNFVESSYCCYKFLNDILVFVDDCTENAPEVKVKIHAAYGKINYSVEH